VIEFGVRVGYGLGLAFRVRFSFKVSVVVLYFINLYSADGATESFGRC